MSGRHMLKYHLLVPAAVFGLLVVVGVQVGTAFVVGIMTGCMSMMLMMLTMDRTIQREEADERHDPTVGHS